MKTSSATYNFLIPALLTLVMPISGSAHEVHAHIHGIASINIAVDQSVLTITLESPLDNLLGFEHQPRNDREKAAAQSLLKQLNLPKTLFALPIKAECQPVEVVLDAPTLTNTAEAGSSQHADLEAEFVFECRQIQHLRAITVTLFQHFPHVHQVNVQVATEHGQTSTKLTRQRAKVEW